MRLAQIRSPELSTARLALRLPTPADIAPMSVLLNDLDVARMLARVPHPYHVTDGETFLAHVAASDPTEQRLFVLETPVDGLVGVVGLDLIEGRTELGYWLGKPFWGRGYMTEAVGAVLKWVGEEWGRRFLVSRHFADNPASGRVLTKTGFLYTGEVRQRMSVARGEAVASRMMVWLA